MKNYICYYQDPKLNIDKVIEEINLFNYREVIFKKLNKDELFPEIILELVIRLLQETKIKYLSLPDDFHLNDKVGEEKLETVLKDNHFVESLFFNFNHKTFPRIKIISEILKVKTSLTKIDLSVDILGVRNAKLIAEGLKANHTLQFLSIHIPHINRDTSTADIEFSAILNSLNNHPSMTSLSITNWGLNFEDISLIKYQTSNLKSLCFSHNRTTNKGLKNLFKIFENTPLTNLFLDYNEIANEGMKDIANFLQTNKIIEKLDCSFNQINEDGLKFLPYFLPQYSKLKTFIIHGPNLDNEEGEELISFYLRNNLTTELSFSINNLNENSFNIIIELLETNNKVKTLNLENCLFHFEDDRFNLAEKLLKALEKNNSLTHLSLFTHLVRDNISQLLKILCNKPQLASINLKNSYDLDKYEQAICSSLKNNKYLVDFNYFEPYQYEIPIVDFYINLNLTYLDRLAQFLDFIKVNPLENFFIYQDKDKKIIQTFNSTFEKQLAKIFGEISSCKNPALYHKEYLAANDIIIDDKDYSQPIKVISFCNLIFEINFEVDPNLIETFNYLKEFIYSHFFTLKGICKNLCAEKNFGLLPNELFKFMLKDNGINLFNLSKQTRDNSVTGEENSEIQFLGDIVEGS